MMKKLMLSAVVLLLLITAKGQNNNPDERPHIKITGTAEIKVVPDLIYISITLKERQEGKENISVEIQENSLYKSLQSNALDLNKLTLTNADIDLIYKRFKKDQGQLQKQYHYIASNAKEVNEFFGILDALNIKDGFISNVDCSKRDSLQKEVRIMAIKSAKEKADYLLDAIGEETGKPLEISQFNNGIQITNTLLNDANEYKLRFDKNSPQSSIQYSKIIIQDSYYIKFSIE